MLFGLKLDKLDTYIVNKEQGIKQLRASLAEDAVSDEWKVNRVEDLSSSIQVIARAEAELQILQIVQHALVLESKPSHAEIYSHLLELVLNGPDDTWSGRGNDLRRTVFDAKRELIRDLKYVLDI